MFRMTKMIFLIAIITFVGFAEEYIGTSSSEQTSETAEKAGNISLETENLLSSGRRMSIAGSVMFFTATAIDLGVLLPIGIGIANDLRDIEEPDMDDLGPSLSLLAASIPVGAVKIAGPIVACAGASRSYRAYKKGIDSSIPDITVWKPYKIGWVFRAIGAGIGLVSGLSPDMQNLSYVGTGFGVVADGFWSAACIKSIKYAEEKKNATDTNAMSITPLLLKKGGGMAFNMQF